MPPDGQTTRQPRHAPRAFSLMELLVVIAIIGLLVGLLIPALAWYRQAANERATRAALQQLHTAAREYETVVGEVLELGDRPGYFDRHEVFWSPDGVDLDTWVDWTPEDWADRSIGQFVQRAAQVEAVNDMLNMINEDLLVRERDLDDFDGDGAGERIVGVVDRWENPLRYKERWTLEDYNDQHDTLPVQRRPFFASAGPDRQWNTVDIDTPTDTDNLYSFQQE